MTTITALLTNKAYGYPTRGARRRRKPTILACLHQTANAKATAIGERTYANRAGSSGPSATAYIDRDGTVVRAIDPAKYAAWSQGDVAHPNTKFPTIAAAVVSGVNMNEWVHGSIECSGAGTEPFTDAQFEATAKLVAAAHKATGLPINRSTVVVHADINSVSPQRPLAAGPREARVKRVIARANAIRRPPIVTVTVKAGDTLREIAASHGLTLKALLAFPENAKYRANPGLIHPGDIVRVKRREEPWTPSSCAACGRHLIGHVERYRHTDACEPFKAAAPRRVQRDGATIDPRVKGESYKAEVYEAAIGRAFEHVAVSARLKVDTVDTATGPEPDGGDVLALARITRERDQAALRFAKDRDLGRLEATMARLDTEAAAAVVRPARTPTAAEARVYLEELPMLWAKTSDAGRHAIAEAVFERIDVLGVTDYTFTLTAHAKARGWGAAFGAGVVRVKDGQSGRGETG